MAKCPNCGKEVTEYEQEFKNYLFCIESYVCPECKHHFHVER